MGYIVLHQLTEQMEQRFALTFSKNVDINPRFRHANSIYFIYFYQAQQEIKTTIHLSLIILNL